MEGPEPQSRQPTTDERLLDSSSAVGETGPASLPQRNFLLAAAGIFLGAVGIRWWFFDVTEFRGDELIYIRYAHRISTAGLSQLRVLAEVYASNPSLWVFPNPLRVLYILITALGCSLAEVCSGATVAAVSLLSGIAMVPLALVMARRMFGDRVALLSGLLVAFSPLQLQLSRRAWQDGLFSLTVLVALWAYWERSQSPRKGWDILLGCALLASLLTKESSIIFAIGLYAALLYPRWVGTPTVPLGRSILAALLLPVPLAALIILILIPDPSLLIHVYSGWLSATGTGEYAIAYSQGPWFRYLIDFFLLSPFTALLAIGYFFTAGGQQVDRFLGRCTLLMFVVFSLLALKNIRYVSFLDIPMRILAVLTLGSLSQHPGVARAGERMVVVTVLLLAVYDLYLFYTIFISGGVYDPVTANLTRAERLVP